MQEESGFCEWCDRFVLLRRLRGAWGWKPWRCTVCGEQTRPSSAPAPLDLAADVTVPMTFFAALLALLVLATIGFAVMNLH